MVQIPKGESAIKGRTLNGFFKWYYRYITAFAVLVAFITIFRITIFGYIIPEMSYFALLLGAFMPLCFLVYPAAAHASQAHVPWYDILLAVASLPFPIYAIIYGFDIILGGWEVSPPLPAKILGGITWVLLIEAVRRISGKVMAAFILTVSIYPLFAHLCPGLLMAKQYSLSRIIGFHTLGTQSIFGIPTQIFGRILIGYMLFAAALQATGAVTVFINFSLALLGNVRGGAAKVSILSSAFFATMSGSALANVITTGAVTIPTMKRLGYPPYYAAAIEACASKGGVLTPPVMGVVAFIMADFIGVSYAKVCIAAAIPITLYWISLFTQADFYAAKTGLKGLPGRELPSLWQAIATGWFYIASLGVLIYFIFFQYLEAYAPFYATGALILMASCRKETRLNIKALHHLLDETGYILTQLVVILAGVGLVIGAMSITGVAHGLSGFMTRIGGQYLYLLLILGALTSFILGIGMTIAACYVFLAMLLAPTLVQIGINEMAAHFFLVYWASVSYITPPVALASYAAASIAQADPLKTSFQALKLGFVSLLVPFFFVYDPALVAQGTALQIIHAASTAVLGIIMLSAGFEGYCFFLKRIKFVTRALFMLAGLCMFSPGLESDAVGIVISGISIGIHLAFTKRPGMAAAK